MDDVMNMKPIALAVAMATMSSFAAAANDDTNYQGDKLSFPVKIKGKLDRPDGGTEICIPKSTSLRGLTNLTEDGLAVQLANVLGTPLDCSKDNVPIPDDRVIYIDKQTIEHSAPTRYGLTYGMLLVPFKYHMQGEHEFASGGTVAPYLGYRFDRNYLGLGFKLVGFLGGAGVSVLQNVDGVETTQTLAGLSTGFGFLGTIKNEFQFGLIFGSDHVSDSANYPRNGEWWVALGVGFSFSE